MSEHNNFKNLTVWLSRLAQLSPEKNWGAKTCVRLAVIFILYLSTITKCKRSGVLYEGLIEGGFLRSNLGGLQTFMVICSNISDIGMILTICSLRYLINTFYGNSSANSSN